MTILREEVRAVKIETTRFGPLGVAEGEVIRMAGPIFGFEPLTRFVLLIHDEGTPLWWLQSMEEPGVAFVVVNPRVLQSGYNPSISEADLESLAIDGGEEIVLLSIVTVHLHPFRVTANLKAPILINAAQRVAKQIVLEDPAWPIQYDVFDHRNVLGQATGRTDFGGGAGALGKCVAAAAP